MDQLGQPTADISEVVKQSTAYDSMLWLHNAMLFLDRVLPAAVHIYKTRKSALASKLY